MMKIGFIFLLFMMSLFGRENPFEDTKDVMNSQIISLKKFIQKDVRFPSTARILNEISFTYTNLDGSVSTKSVKIDKMINWHDSFEVLRKLSKDQPGDVLISVKIPPDPLTKQNEQDAKELLKIKLQGYKIIILTDDDLMRNLSVQNPSVIMLDFKHSLKYLFKVSKLKKPPFTKLEFSSYKNFYRIKIFLDGKYGYKLVKGSNKYIITLY